MFFLGYLFFYSLLSTMLDLSILFSIISFMIGMIFYFNTTFTLQGIEIFAFGLLHLISRLCYHSKGMRVSGSSYVNYNISYNFLSISIATIIFAIPVWYIIITSKVVRLAISPFYLFIPSLFIAWAILFKIVDRIFIHNRESQELVLGDYFSIYKSRKHGTQTYIFKFENSSDLYSTGMWRYRIFIDKIGSKFSCTFGKGIFGTTYITNIKLIEDAGINAPENQNSYSIFPFKKFPWTILLLVNGISILIFGIFFLFISHISSQNSDIKLLKYIELYKFIGLSGVILGITLTIISIFIFTRKK